MTHIELSNETENRGVSFWNDTQLILLIALILAATFALAFWVGTMPWVTHHGVKDALVAIGGTQIFLVLMAIASGHSGNFSAAMHLLALAFAVLGLAAVPGLAIGYHLTHVVMHVMTTARP